MEAWQSIILVAASIAIVLNLIVLISLWRALGTGSYRRYIRNRYEQQGELYDKLMKRTLEDLNDTDSWKHR